MNYSKGNKIIASLGVALIFMPYIFMLIGVTFHIATEILIYSIFAIGFNILLGYTGIVSFGHAAFFGVGAYILGFTQIYLTPSAWISISLGVVAAGIVSVGICYLIIKKHGIYFALLTMALGQIFYFMVYRFTEITGGENGLSGIKPPIVNILGIELNFANSVYFYYLVLLIFVIEMLIIWRFINSPFGKVIQGIKENENRMKYLGYNTQKYRVIAFVLSATFSGLAGSLYAIHLRFAFPQLLHWTTSGDVVMIALIGGLKNFFGPILGAAIFILSKDIISSFTDRWMIIMGSIFIFFVILSPEGILGLFEKGKKKSLKEFLKSFKRYRLGKNA